jgi:hypothetical protein
LDEPTAFIFRVEETEKYPTMKKEAAGSTRMLAPSDQTAQYHGPEDSTIHNKYLFFK